MLPPKKDKPSPSPKPPNRAAEAMAKVISILLPPYPDAVIRLRDKLTKHDWSIYKNRIRGLGKEEGKKEHEIEDVLTQTEEEIKAKGGFIEEDKK